MQKQIIAAECITNTIGCICVYLNECLLSDAVLCKNEVQRFLAGYAAFAPDGAEFGNCGADVLGQEFGAEAGVEGGEAAVNGGQSPR